jgi:hypothetical protein
MVGCQVSKGSEGSHHGLIQVVACRELGKPQTILSTWMPSSGMWRRVDLVWIDVSEESIASIFRVEKSAGSSFADFSTLKMKAIRSSETSVHTRFTRRHIPEDGILHSHRREKLKSYNSESVWLVFKSRSVPVLFISDKYLIIRWFKMYRAQQFH